MLALGWGIAAMLGALSGMMAAPTIFLDPNMMRAASCCTRSRPPLLGGSTACGRRRRGLVLGMLNLLGTYVDFFGGEMRLVGGLLVILGVLYFRPQGSSAGLRWRG